MPSGAVGGAAYRRGMLTTVAVSGYRSLRDVVVPLHGLDVVTGANGSGKSSLYRALRLLAGCGRGDVVGTLAREGGLQSALWAGPATLGGARREGHAVQGTARKGPISLRLGFASDDLGYLVDLGLPQQSSGRSRGRRGLGVPARPRDQAGGGVVGARHAPGIGARASTLGAGRDPRSGRGRRRVGRRLGRRRRVGVGPDQTGGARERAGGDGAGPSGGARRGWVERPAPSGRGRAC